MDLFFVKFMKKETILLDIRIYLWMLGGWSCYFTNLKPTTYKHIIVLTRCSTQIPFIYLNIKSTSASHFKKIH